MIRKVDGYAVFSHKKKHKKLSRVYKSKKAAAKRLKQIRYFKFLRGGY
jgi:hypothetical protein